MLVRGLGHNDGIVGTPCVIVYIMKGEANRTPVRLVLVS